MDIIDIMMAKKLSGGGAVSSVNGKTGAVILTPSDIGIGTVFNLKGSKATIADLPASDNEIGDVWYVVAESVGYIWLNDGTTDRWEQLGISIDLSTYATQDYVNQQIAAQTAETWTFTLEDDTTVTKQVLVKAVSGS